jgi:glucokinase
VTTHLGIDLGVTNLKWAVVEHADDAWQTVDRGQTPTEAAEGQVAVVERMIGLGRLALERWPAIDSVGVGVPGLYDPVEGVTRFLVNMPDDWAGRPVAAPIRAALGIPVSLINDARAFGLAELRLGAGRGVSSMIGFTLGTGVGGVVAIDGRVLQGHDGTAGELGHQTIDPDGPLMRLREPRLPGGACALRPDRRCVRDCDRRRSRRGRPCRR